MRIGTTSYIYPADIITNVRRLAGKVKDIELVLFESDSDGSNLPDDSVISELKLIAAEHEMTYTVHLPLDIYPADDHPFLDAALRVIQVTEKLDPHGYVIHLDSRNNTGDISRLVDNSLNSLKFLSENGVPAESICVENLENHPPGFLDPVLSQSPVSCCADIGHLWKTGLDPVGYLQAWLGRTRIVHLHGFLGHDHRRLSLMEPEQLDPVIEILSERFFGVLTLEIFKERDLWDSLNALEASVKRVGHSH